jgi:rsbT co-antagonist protein RsbR
MSAAEELAKVEAELAQVEAQIREADALLEAVFTHSPHGVCIGKTDGSLVVNPVGEKLLGGVQNAEGADAWTKQYGLFLEDGKTPFPPQQLPLARALGGESNASATVRMRSPARPEGVWLDVLARPLPDGSAVAIFRDVTHEREARTAVVERTLELEKREAENRELVERLRTTLEALSTPILQIGPGVLVVPVIGVVDTQRSAGMTEKILFEVMRARASHLIVDLTGVAVIDTSTADRLLKMAAALRLLGTECVVSGIQPAVAQTLVAIGVDLGVLRPHRDLEQAFRHCATERAKEEEAEAPKAKRAARSNRRRGLLGARSAR